MFVTENELSEWVLAHAKEAQGTIVELVWRLVAASSPGPRERRFPLGDSVGQPGPDGLLNAVVGFEPFVPEGWSFWEVGTGNKAGKKATDDYRDLTRHTPEEMRKEAAFIFVTPLSGRRDWSASSKKPDAQVRWTIDRQKKGEWKTVKVIDGTKLIDWLRAYPAVAMWLAEIIRGIKPAEVETIEQHWNVTKSIGEPPPLPQELFLANREDACSKIAAVFDSQSLRVKLETHFPGQVVDFVAAFVARLDHERRVEAAGRCLVVSSPSAWKSLMGVDQKLVLVADAAMDLGGDGGTRLLHEAQRARHAVIFSGQRGGPPDPASVLLRLPRSYDIQNALEKGGYRPEKARSLAQRSSGNLSSLLRFILNQSLSPEWFDDSVAGDLAIATAIGSWDDSNEADTLAAGKISGKAQGEWIKAIRALATRPGTPLIHRGTTWRVIGRFEAWYAAGPRLFDEELERLGSTARDVLAETDPALELDKNDRYAAAVHGKVLRYSTSIRSGLADSLALLGSQPGALTAVSHGRPEAIAATVVRELLNGAEWARWASLNTLLPLLAEASPEGFLESIERAVGAPIGHSPFDQLYAQEGDGFTGGNYMSGVLWALETLAWSPDYFSRAMLCLAALASRDPGGRWANRPLASLTSVLLPWLPQTCAVLALKKAVLLSVLQNYPSVGWKLLMQLLPQFTEASMGTRRPAWREFIPEDWPTDVTGADYSRQVNEYSSLSVAAAKGDPTRVADLIERLDGLPAEMRSDFLDYLASDDFRSRSDDERMLVWNNLVELSGRHRRFPSANWVMPTDVLERIEAVAARVAPTGAFHTYQQLFTDREWSLFAEKDDYEEQVEALQQRREQAVREVVGEGGVLAVVKFAAAVESPWKVGFAYGAAGDSKVDARILPIMLDSAVESDAKFARGFVRGRWHSKGLPWVDELGLGAWSSGQVVALLCVLPFNPAIWTRATALLVDDTEYWLKAVVNPFEAADHLDEAADKLLAVGRALASAHCVERMFRRDHKIDIARGIAALLSAPGPTEDVNNLDTYEIVSLIKALQDDPETNADEMSAVEWRWLGLLDDRRAASPKFLELRLARDPGFFMTAVQKVFRPSGESADVSESDESGSAGATRNAYRLLRQWRTPPGLRDGVLDGAALGDWVEAVKVSSRSSGHFDVAMMMAGHMMKHVPSDPDGLFLNRAAAELLDSKDAAAMRDGFRTEIFNSRGAHYVDPSGAPERRLAAENRSKAEDLDRAGFHRLATTFRELARAYEREAEFVSARFDGDA